MTLTPPAGPVVAGMDIFAPQLLEDPYPWYAELRRMGVVTYPVPVPAGAEVTLLTRFADVQAVLRDPRFGRSGFRKAAEVSMGDGPLTRSFSSWMLFRDPPDHTRLRGLVNKAFTPRAVEALRSQIHQIVERLLDNVRGEPSFDLITDFAYPLPVLVICELLGVPEEDRHGFGVWSAALGKALDNVTIPDATVLQRGNEAAAGLTDYFRELVRSRRGIPAEDLLHGLVGAEEQGDRLSEEELLSTCVLLFFAGHETTVNLIGNGTLALLRNRDQMARLQADFSLMPNAVEELLRYDSPVQRTGRIVGIDLELNGRFYRQGHRVNLFVGAANRDPDQFADPDRLDISRANAAQHLSFAAGIHYCVGAPLARLEAQLAIEGLLRCAPRLRLLTNQPLWKPTFVLRGLASLPVVLS
jgi:cytochrome P450